MKPLEARLWTEQSVDLLSAGQPLPPTLRAWLVGALRRRLAEPKANLDALLGLRSRRGGALHAFSRYHDRDRALAALAPGSGDVAARAEVLRARIAAHRLAPDPELAQIEEECGRRVPGSLEQLQRILSGRTAACQMIR